jgi:hypothetical protein
MDFSKLVFDATKVLAIMSDPSGNANRLKYEKKGAELIVEEQKYELMQNKELISAQKKFTKIETIRQELIELELVKDKENLSPGLKKILRNMFVTLKYNKRKISLTDKPAQLQKGAEVEKHAIALISELDGIKYSKNKTSFKNQWVQGRPDIVIGKKPERSIIDVKTDIDAPEFYSRIQQEKASGPIQWQMQTYMWLVGCEQAHVHYCLVNPPDWLINMEIDKLQKRLSYQVAKGRRQPVSKSEFHKEVEQLCRDLTFDNIPPIERRIPFTIYRDDEMIGRIAKRVEVCREYLQEFQEMHTKYFYKHV